MRVKYLLAGVLVITLFSCSLRTPGNYVDKACSKLQFDYRSIPKEWYRKAPTGGSASTGTVVDYFTPYMKERDYRVHNPSYYWDLNYNLYKNSIGGFHGRHKR